MEHQKSKKEGNCLVPTNRPKRPAIESNLCYVLAKFDPVPALGRGLPSTGDGDLTFVSIYSRNQNKVHISKALWKCNSVGDCADSCVQ